MFAWGICALEPHTETSKGIIIFPKQAMNENNEGQFNPTHSAFADIWDDEVEDVAIHFK